MNNMKINLKNRTIEITKQFEKEASIVGSMAYKELIETRNDFPNFKIVTKKTTKRSTFMGGDYEFMEKYISTHENAENNLIDFNKLRKMNVSYGEIRDWFIKTYPVFKDCKTRVDWYLAS